MLSCRFAAHGAALCEQNARGKFVTIGTFRIDCELFA
jgi:hypothetical protein